GHWTPCQGAMHRGGEPRPSASPDAERCLVERRDDAYQVRFRRRLEIRGNVACACRGEDARGEPTREWRVRRRRGGRNRRTGAVEVRQRRRRGWRVQEALRLRVREGDARE